MRVRNRLLTCLAVALGAGLLAAAAPVPRPAPALAFADPANQPTSLQAYRGKVVMIEFLLTHCPHCWRLSQTVTRLQHDLGPRGFQAIGIAFDKDLLPAQVSNFAKLANAGFPVGLATSDQVDAFLGRGAGEQFQVPQIVIVDRGGTIRAQSHATKETTLESEADLRHLLESLLAEK
jgi:peroxiredoxin